MIYVNQHGLLWTDESVVYLVGVVLQRAVVAVITHPVPVGISLIHVVNIRAVVVLVQNA